MKVTAVEIGNQALVIEGEIHTTSCYKAFMNYCIENYPVETLIAPPLNKYFKIGSRNPEFLRSIDYGRVKGHNRVYYSDWMGTPAKIKRMNKIADVLGLHLHLFDDQGLIV